MYFVIIEEILDIPLTVEVNEPAPSSRINSSNLISPVVLDRSSREYWLHPPALLTKGGPRRGHRAAEPAALFPIVDDGMAKTTSPEFRASIQRAFGRQKMAQDLTTTMMMTTATTTTTSSSSMAPPQSVYGPSKKRKVVPLSPLPPPPPQSSSSRDDSTHIGKNRVYILYLSISINYVLMICTNISQIS
jgi:hypothetical protein